jgi:hypothetical protein
MLYIRWNFRNIYYRCNIYILYILYLKVGNTKLKGTRVQIKGKRAYAFYLAQILSHSTIATVPNATSLALVIF